MWTRGFVRKATFTQYPGQKAHRRFRFVAQNLLNLRKYLGCQFRDDLERLQVVDHLLGFGCAKDDRACVRLLCDPSKGEVRDFAAKF